MSTKTVTVCDRCKKEQEAIWTPSVCLPDGYSNVRFEQLKGKSINQQSFQLCASCKESIIKWIGGAASFKIGDN